jgi:small conductance mechanosensitive channel
MTCQSRRQSSLLRFGITSILACGLVILLSSPVVAQLSPVFLQTNDEVQKVLGWDPNRSYDCGRLVCSDVILPGTLSPSFTLAQQIDPGEPKEEIEAAVEDRVKLVENIVASIQRTMLEQRRTAWLEGAPFMQRDRQFYWNRILKQGRNHAIQLLSLRTPSIAELELHPDTPAIEMGIRNNQTVVFIPEQVEYGLPQQTIVTVTELDLLHAGIRILNPTLGHEGANGSSSESSTADATKPNKPVPETNDETEGVTGEDLAKESLANLWRGAIRKRLSDALWGQDHDWQYPHDRFGMVIATVSLAIGLIVGVDWLQNLLRGVRRRLQQRAKELQNVLMKDRETAAMEGPLKDEGHEGSESDTAHSAPDSPPKLDSLSGNGALSPGASPRETPSMPPTPAQSDEASIFHTPDAHKHTNQPPATQAPMTPPQVLVDNSLEAVLGIEQAVKDQIQNLIQKVPLDQQSRIRQWQNLLQLFRRSLFWVEVIIMLGSATLITLVFPGSRLYAIFFLTQAILLPTIWMVISLLDIAVDFVSDRYLHQWAKSAQIDNPSSDRYALRVNTYSPAIQGATTVLFVALGIYLTILAFGINPSVLASAGAAAVIIAFLSRNLLEDMLNGALILWTDRYAIGDIVQVGTIVGLVENMNLYVTQVRGAEGRLATIPNGQIRIVENLTKDWSRVDFTIEIAHDADVTKALEIIQDVSERMRSEDPWNERILEPASILGVDAVTHAGILIQVWIKTQPIQQFAVGREFRLRIKQAFDEAGIALGVPQQEVSYHNGNALPARAATQSNREETGKP